MTSSKLKAHLFVCTSCTYSCADGVDSSPEEALHMRRNLKNRAREIYSKNEVRVSASTCLGECEHGIAAVMYPSGQWFLGLRPTDEDKLFDKITEQITPD